MPVQEILELAHQGNPTAIGTLINYITQPRGIKVRVQRQDNDLHILVESEPFPNQQEAMAFIQDTLKELQARPIQTVTIYGRQQGERIPAWQQTIAWQGHPIAEQPESLPKSPPETQAEKGEEITTSPAVNLQPTEVTPSELAETEIIEGKVVQSDVSRPETIHVMEPEVALSSVDEAAIVPRSPSQLSPQVLSESELSVPELSTSLNPTLGHQYNAASSAVSLTSRNSAFLKGLLDPLTYIDTSLPLMESSDTPEVLKRPESVFFLFFISILTVWEAYLTLLEEDETQPKKVLSTSQLARRLQTSKRTIRRQKRLEGFSEWTQSLDPDGIAWSYSRGVYLPSVG